MFSVTSESSATSPVRSEPPRLSAPDVPSQPNGFAALVDANAQAPAEPSRPAPTDRRDSPQASPRTSRQDRDQREAAPDAAASPPDAPRNAESTAAGENSHQTAEKPSKQTKSGKTSDDSADAKSGQTSDTGTATASTPDIPLDPSAIAVAMVTAPATPAPAASPAPSGSAATAPLSIAAAAIAASAQASGNDASPIAEAVAGAASEVNATNFTIAKTIATTPVPATELEAEAQPTAAPQLASAVATAASKVIKSGDKLPVARTEAAADAAPSDSASQPPSPTAAPPSSAQPGAAQASQHPQGKADADATPASSPSLDRSNGDSATPSVSGHHAATVASQPQAPTPDALFQLGTTMTAPQAPATTAIPAAQLTATAMTNLAVPVSGLAVQIAASARAGNSRFEIRLDPAELGRIDIRLDVDKHGQVSSHLTVEKPETLAMLRQDAPQLQRALEDAGLKTGQNGLQFSLRDQSTGQQDNGQSGRQPQRLMISDTATAAPLAPVNATYAYAASAIRGLDIRV